MTTFYLGSVLDAGILTTASDISIAAGATAVGQDSPLGTLTGYGELPPHSAAGVWPALSSEAAVLPSGNGNIYPTDLSNQALVSNTWAPTLRLNVTGISPSAITADLIFRVWKYSSNTLTYTKIGTISLTGQSISNTAATYTLPTTALAQVTFASGEYLYLDIVANVTANPNGAGVGTKIRCNFSNSASTGNATSQVIAPALAPARLIPTTTALIATNTRTMPATTALSSPGLTRTVPATASLCGGPLALSYVQPIPDSNFITASGTHLRYKGQNIKLYGCTIYLSTQGGATIWQGTGAKAVLDNLFLRAYQNGLSMIRITDYWDGSHVTAMDNAQLWTNIDYCVTLAQKYGMFVMMDVSAYKNVIVANGQDPTIAANWTDFLNFVGHHYANKAPNICWYNLLGEPSLPTDQASTDALVSFYTTLCNTIQAADNSTHLISSGGLTHMNSNVPGISYASWWLPIFQIASNSICSIKDYSVNDLAYMSTIQTLLNSAGLSKPISCNEFGAQQEQGDASFPAFSNTLSSGITQGATVTSLSLTATISQSIAAGTIIALSGNENCVVATTTASGTSLPVTSFIASKAHVSGDSVTALGFADIGHSLADTADNYYRAVFGLSTTIQKWNNGPRTVVTTPVLGGDQLGISSYVVWNLGDQVQGAGYDVSNTVMTGAWALMKSKAQGDGLAPVAPATPAALFPATARRTGVFPSTGRRTGVFPATKRRQS